MVDITAGAEFCHGDTIFSIAQLVMRTLLFSYLIFLRYDMFFVNQVALFFILIVWDAWLFIHLNVFFIC